MKGNISRRANVRYIKSRVRMPELHVHGGISIAFNCCMGSQTGRCLLRRRTLPHSTNGVPLLFWWFLSYIYMYGMHRGITVSYSQLAASFSCTHRTVAIWMHDKRVFQNISSLSTTYQTCTQSVLYLTPLYMYNNFVAEFTCAAVTCLMVTEQGYS